jgi:hypothetical protein
MSGGLTTCWDDRKTIGESVSPSFHTYWREVYEIREREQSGVIDFQMANIHTGRYGDGAQESSAQESRG